MNINYDKDADCLYIQFQQGKVHHTNKIEDGILVDLDEKGKIFGIEIVGASEKIPIESISKISISKAAIDSGLTVGEIEEYMVREGYKSKYSVKDLKRELELLNE